MKRLASTLLSLWMLVPALAHASTIEDVQVSSDGQDVIVLLEGDVPADRPIVRTASGMVRLWVEAAPDQAALRKRVDSPEVAYVDVRSGSRDTAAIKIRLAGRQHVPSSAVRVSQDGRVVTIRIARVLLAPGTELARSTTPHLVDRAEPNKGSAPKELPTAKAVPVAPPQPKPLLPTKVFTKPPKALSAATLAPDSRDSMLALLGVSAVLGFVYLGLRLVQGKRKKPAISPIEVIASKRLGPRHQLLIIRAFGRDHLLSVQGGNTTRIAGAKAGQLLGADDHLTAGSFELEGELKASPEPAFGADFLRLAIGQRLHQEMQAEKAMAQPPSRTSSSSDSVSGLMRLRREAGL